MRSKKRDILAHMTASSWSSKNTLKRDDSIMHAWIDQDS